MTKNLSIPMHLAVSQKEHQTVKQLGPGPAHQTLKLMRVMKQFMRSSSYSTIATLFWFFLQTTPLNNQTMQA